MNCIFCKIANGEIPTNSLFENENFRVILDAAPANPGHALVLPKSHAGNIFEMSDELIKEGFSIAKKVAEALKKAGLADGVNILQNNGEVAGQTVDHFHIHIIPRKEADGVVIKSETFKMTDEETSKVKETLFELLK